MLPRLWRYTLYPRSSDMRTFTIIWCGQLVSLVGTAMTRFALLIWVYEQTGAATPVALLGVFSFGASVVACPFAGVVIDRMDRRLVMIWADLGAGLMTLGLFVLFTTDHLHVWHLYLAQALTGVFEAFQIPAYSAAITTLIPKQHYVRASGMRSLADAASQVSAPLFAGFLLILVGIGGVMLIDVATLLVAVGTLLCVRVPRLAMPQDDTAPRRDTWRELRVGFEYIFQRPGLLGLMLIYTGMNLFAALTYYSILPAMVLARSGQDRMALASVQAALGAGGLVGGLCVSIWGGPKRRLHGILAAAAASFLLGDFLFAVGRSVAVWVVAACIAEFFVPIIMGSDRAIWQAKVVPQVQGRVFSVQRMLRQAMMPLGYLLAGPLADHVFEPAMAPGGSLVALFGWLVGIGAGAGMAVMFLCTGLLGMLMSLSGYAFRAVRPVEDDLPDHDAVPMT